MLGRLVILPLLCTLMVILPLLFQLCDFAPVISNRREHLPLFCEEGLTVLTLLRKDNTALAPLWHGARTHAPSQLPRVAPSSITAVPMTESERKTAAVTQT
jgi:hypothetical protein